MNEINKKVPTFNFIIIGCGGTGGNFIKEFCRFVASLEKRNVNICLVDGDIVEEKNIARQPFLEEDINKNKAVALAEICGSVFDLDISSYPYYLTSSEQLAEIVSSMKSMSTSSEQITVLIGCVDNHRARQVLHEYFNGQSDILYFDSANEFSNGEVVFGSKIGGCVVSPARSFYFPEILLDQSPNREEMSCEELNSVAGQHIVTNIMAANILLSASAQLIKTGALPEGIVFFDAFDFTMRKRVVKKEEIPIA